MDSTNFKGQKKTAQGISQLSLLSATLGLLTFGAVNTAQAASFRGIGFLPEVRSTRVYGVSADGSVVFGDNEFSSSTEAFRWTEAEGMQGLGVFPGGRGSYATGTSADGSIIAGWSGTSTKFNPEAFRWTQAEGLLGLGALEGGHYSEAHAISANGEVIVGNSGTSGPNYRAFRWTQDEGMVELGGNSSAYYNSEANGVSADGKVIVGNFEFQAFRWTQAEGIQKLSTLGGFSSDALDVSADGEVVVGYSDTGTHFEAFRWTQAEGMKGLGTLYDYPESRANGVSADGQIIVGQSYPGAFIWDSSNGIRDLANVLTHDFGLDLTGWSLDGATGVSADGKTIVGNGLNPDGKVEGWVARLDTEPKSVPESQPLNSLTLLPLLSVGAFLKRFPNTNRKINLSRIQPRESNTLQQLDS